MAQGMRIPTTADLMSMWNASGLKEKIIYFHNARSIPLRRSLTVVWY